MVHQAKPNCCLWAGTGAKRKSTSRCLLAVPEFDRIAGLYNRHLALTGEYAYAKDFESGFFSRVDLFIGHVLESAVRISRNI